MPPRGISEDYVMVNERIERFMDEYPDGSLQSEIIDLTDSIVVIKAYAYRSPEDPKPGIGHSFLRIPGKTPFTRDSELENCETSAWGRALAALGFEVHRSIATVDEIENKGGSVTISGSSVEGVGRGGRTKSANPVQVQQVRLLSRDLGLGNEGMAELIAKTLKTEVQLPDDDEEAKEFLVDLLFGLSSDGIGSLLQAMTAAREAMDDEPDNS